MQLLYIKDNKKWMKHDYGQAKCQMWKKARTGMQHLQQVLRYISIH